MKHRFSFLLIWISFGIPMLASCQNPTEPRSVIKKAIEAHGGEKNISRPRIGVLKAASKGEGPEITQVESFELPRRWKRTTSMTFEGKKRVSFNLMSEGKFWEWEEGGEARQTQNEQRSEPHFAVVAVLVKLMGEEFNLSLLPRERVNDKPAIGIRALWDDGAADYYFDEKTGLLVQAKFKWQPEPGKEFDTKTIIGDYKDIDRVKFPYRQTRYIRGGNHKDYVQLADFFVTEVRILDKLPDDAFSLPAKK